ncbi:hypothetical protein DICPUDRAFT_88372 [Dictyostelium purpureum]|uniref:Alpha-1,3/1,6-mannosyltransferase ALG2 n=1 Tax=Dictyostelium purpureum TaxID=5786 RepID=F0ZP08_DICPU|nr:uncharacterized protein DICPUDRAFT_88372 [Dictyostelium purpureum]EGC34322.1 hypothetical protein DICPUDRAFT_88372 [Dictyostelium purpureum]|eukprot:XP_003289158.1 hypothetical protein DICPUDRAFT_88372 [Dictyostelium purpureum]
MGKIKEINDDEDKYNIAILHPDLGIGGAERLIVDVALGLKSCGHKIDVYTSRHDPTRCFRETANGDLNVKVCGDYFPRHFLNRFMVICAIIRNLLAAIHIIFFSKKHLSPLFKWFTKSKVLFYCHFPDKLLTSRNSTIKRLYRVPIDLFEEWTTSCADEILVNSNFTSSIFKKSFTHIKKSPNVLYPCLNTVEFDKTKQSSDFSNQTKYNNKPISLENKEFFLSINRYERKKDLKLALDSFSVVYSNNPNKDIYLVFAGGYDTGLKENVEHLEELKEKTKEYGLEDRVFFLCSINEGQKQWLLLNCCCLVYTPSFEHFGITPLEGMYASKPVIAVNNGGPLETVVDSKTGFLCPPDQKDFSEAFQKIISDPLHSKKMGFAGKQRVNEKFSFKPFANNLNTISNNLMIN